MNPNSRSQNAQKAAAPLTNYEFDFGLGFKPMSGSSLNAQKQKPAPPSSSSTPQSSTGGASWTHKPSSTPQSSSGTTSWTHKPSSSSPASSWTSWSSTASQNSLGGSLNGPARSMVGDISGKSWGAMDNPKLGSSGLVGGLSRGAAPDLFGDLVKGPISRSSVPLKEASRSSFAMDSVGASLPKGVPLKDAKVSRAKDLETAQKEETGDFASAFPSSADPLRSASSGGDVWGAFEGVSSATNSASRKVNESGLNKGGEDPFGEFQGGSTFATAATPPVGEDPFAASVNASVDLFGDFTKPSKGATDDVFDFASNLGSAPDSNKFSQANSNNGTDPFASFLSGTKSSERSNLVSDPFESLLKTSPSPKISGPTKSEDPLMDSLWSSTNVHSGVSPPNSDMLHDLGMENDFGEFQGGTTTELEGLPPPPAGVTTAIARDKGIESYKQGQFADAIKWLSWAERTVESSGEDSMLVEVLSCRASCLKEVGEYKKAVADCSKVIEMDKDNSAMLLQRALLYESTEKYKLGIADLREVLKIEPQNRVASNTLSRLIKMGE